MVTHSSTSRPVQCLCMAERTGCPIVSCTSQKSRFRIIVKFGATSWSQNSTAHSVRSEESRVWAGGERRFPLMHVVREDGFPGSGCGLRQKRPRHDLFRKLYQMLSPGFCSIKILGKVHTPSCTSQAVRLSLGHCPQTHSISALEITGLNKMLFFKLRNHDLTNFGRHGRSCVFLAMAQRSELYAVPDCH
jgi:hypothetical protein